MRGKKNSSFTGKSWDVIVESLKTYRNVTGKNDYISRDYVIPSTLSFPSHLHAIKLGYHLDTLRLAYRKGKVSKDQKDTLDQYQMHWDYMSYKLNFITLPALDMYKNIFGHVGVPVAPSYVIPSEQPWPEVMWEMKLGVQVERWRRDKKFLPSYAVQALNERDFIWSVSEDVFQTFVIALKMYKELKGNLLIPKRFRVPATSQWPESTHGLQLGNSVLTTRRQRGIDTTRDKILDAMNFMWDPVRYQFEKVMLLACQFYVHQNGNLNTISTSFKVPKTPDLYPIECQGYGLGDKLQQWRLYGARPDLLKEITALGFKPSRIYFTQRDLSTLLKGLESFHTIFGYKERVKTYGKASTRLPVDHPTLPGLQLGELFHRAMKWDEKVGFSDTDRTKLKVFATWNSVYQSNIYPLLKLYYLLNGDLNIRFDFQVPSCSPWPTWSWQQKLGSQTGSIRRASMSLSEEDKDVLDSMDFKWGPKGRTNQRESKRYKVTK